MHFAIALSVLNRCKILFIYISLGWEWVLRGCWMSSSISIFQMTNTCFVLKIENLALEMMTNLHSYLGIPLAYLLASLFCRRKCISSCQYINIWLWLCNTSHKCSWPGKSWRLHRLPFCHPKCPSLGTLLECIASLKCRHSVDIDI